MVTSAANGVRRASSKTASHGLLEQKESAAFRGQRLAAVPSDLLTLKNLVRVDLSMNQITRFPGAFVAAEMLRLEVLLLQDNLLYVLEDVLALSESPRLRELDLQRNPLRLQNNRVYLLEALFSQPGCDEGLLTMAHKDEQLKFHSDSNGGGERLRSPHTMAYRKKLPRKRGFPLLMRLNGEWITDSEIKDVEVECGHTIEYFRPLAAQTKHQIGSNSRGRTKSSKQTGRPQVGETGKAARSDKEATRRFDGSRMTVKQMLRNEARSAGIPMARVIQKIQIDAENGDEVSLEDEAQRDTAKSTTNDSIGSVPSHTGVNEGDDEKTEEQTIIHRLFQPSASVLRSSSIVSTAQWQRSTGNPEVFTKPVSQGGGHRHDADDEDDEDDEEEEVLEPWNYPISTFDTLNSEERQYVRFKSKQIGSTIERDDHFFDSSVFLDCVAQAERSRRLTVRAVDLLSQQNHHHDHRDILSSSGGQYLRGAPAGSQSTPSLPTCSAASTLVDSMNAKFTKQLDHATYEKILAFQEKHLSVDSLHIQAAVGDYYQSEHVLQKQRNKQMLSAQAAATASHHHHHSSVALHSTASASTAAAGVETTIEDSLSKLKLRNAVDLANTLLDPKQQKRMLQLLIDADEKVIEEERVTQEQTAHKYRLHLINARSYTPHDKSQIDELVRKVNNTSESPWQRRNWKAIEVEQQSQRQQQLPETDHSTAKHQHPTACTSKKATAKLRSPPSTAPEGVDLAKPPEVSRFRTIETVERAAQDALPGVNSHDLLVRCAEIRQHADKHMKALAQHRDRFQEDEAAWEHMRQDPTNLVRRHLKRRLYQHAQEVQIGSSQFFYSSLFND